MIPSYVTITLALILVIFVVAKRVKKDNKVEGAPLGIPVGSIRALMAIIVISFPFGYLILDMEIPSVILNTIFVVVAFYFQKRADPTNIKELVAEIRSEKKGKKKKGFYPLYLPKYSVRITLVVILAIILVLNAQGPDVPFQSTDTLLELLIIIVFFIIGMIFHGIGERIQKRVISKKLDKFEGTDEELIEELKEQNKHKRRRRKSFLSILTITCVVASLTLFTLNNPTPYYLGIDGLLYLEVRYLLLLMLNVYFGLRQ